MDWKDPKWSWTLPDSVPEHFLFGKGFTNRWTMPNMNDPVIYVNRDITKRVKGIVSFEDFTNRMLKFLLRSQFVN